VPGWEGEFCQWETDECSSNPCKNNGTCVDLLNTYRWVAKTQLDGANTIWMNRQARDASCGRLVVQQPTYMLINEVARFM